MGEREGGAESRGRVPARLQCSVTHGMICNSE